MRIAAQRQWCLAVWEWIITRGEKTPSASPGAGCNKGGLGGPTAQELRML